MLATDGALKTMRTLLDKPDPSSGFVDLLMDGRPDLAVEAVALEGRYSRFFTDKQLDTAYQRLKGASVNPPPPLKRDPATFIVPFEQAAALQLPSVPHTLSPEALPTGDERLKAMVEVTLRPQQSAFREALRRKYGDGCQITDCQLMTVVHASHLVSVSNNGTDDVENGLLLRADIHILFDADMIGIDPDTLVVNLSPTLAVTEYASIAGKKLRIGQGRPNRSALDSRWARFKAINPHHADMAASPNNLQS